MKKPAKAAIVLLSGGLDSMVAAGLAREAGHDLYALTINYNQRHLIELEAKVSALEERLGLEDTSLATSGRRVPNAVTSSGARGLTASRSVIACAGLSHLSWWRRARRNNRPSPAFP